MTTTGGRVRMAPQDRREQLLELGARLLSTRTLEELSIEVLAEEAGISRGLLYHYFGNKQEFHLAVVRRAVDDLYAVTAPDPGAEPAAMLTHALAAYLHYVVENHVGYVSLVRACAGGNEELRTIYDDARRALTSRIFEVTTPAEREELGIADTPITRLLVDGWAAMVEATVLDWVADPQGISREVVLGRLGQALLAIASEDA